MVLATPEREVMLFLKQGWVILSELVIQKLAANVTMQYQQTSVFCIRCHFGAAQQGKQQRPDGARVVSSGRPLTHLERQHVPAQSSTALAWPAPSASRCTALGSRFALQVSSVDVYCFLPQIQILISPHNTASAVACW